MYLKTEILKPWRPLSEIAPSLPKKDCNTTTSIGHRTIDLTTTCDTPMFPTKKRLNMLSTILATPHQPHQYQNITSVIAMYSPSKMPTLDSGWTVVFQRTARPQNPPPPSPPHPQDGILFVEVYFMPYLSFLHAQPIWRRNALSNDADTTHRAQRPSVHTHR